MREKGQTEVAKTLETPVFSRGIEILTEKIQFKVFIFDEADILEAMYDFLKSLADGENALDDLHSMALLKKWVQEYLL